MQIVETDAADPSLIGATRVFRRLVEDGDEPGGSFAVLRGGELLAWGRGGTADDRGSRWTAETLVQVFSAGKPLVALAALLAVRDGVLALDDPVTRWWPAYTDHPESPTTLRMILSHTSGKWAFPLEAESIPLNDTAALIRALERTPPDTIPGTRLTEHAATYGHLVDGLLAAAGAPSVADRAAEISEALGGCFRFGVPDADLHRVATLVSAEESWRTRHLLRDVPRRALSVPRGLLDLELLSTPGWRQTPFGAVGLTTDALSLASFYDDLVRPEGAIEALLGPDLRQALISPAATGYDDFAGRDEAWGLGLSVAGGEIGMGGIGGSAAWHSQKADYSMAYVTRGLADHRRADAVADAVEAALRTT
jgi:CubicO group peptidase (beta-lactamase class C family)